MKRIATAIAVLAMTAVPAFAQPAGGMHPMMQHPEMKAQMMRSPQHLLMMAYHKNIISFARVLDKVARQGETVPPDVARTAVAEMRRSLDEIEKQRAGATQKVPPEMQKMMDEHLVAMKNHLRDLETLTRSDRIPSQEVLKHTQFLIRGCDQSQCDLGRGMHRKGMQGMGGCDRHPAMRGGCDCTQMMPQHRQMMEQMQAKIKAQDQELASLVDKMNRAPRDKKVDLLADIVSRMVQQRTEFVNQMEKMQQEHMMHHQHMMQQHMMQQSGATMPPPPTMTGGEDQESYDEDVDSYDNDDSDMDMEDMNMDAE